MKLLDFGPLTTKAQLSAERKRKKRAGRVICLNEGCDNLAQRKTDTRYSPFCQTCKTRYSKGFCFPEHITPIKTFRCTNEHGILGFSCVVNWKLVDEMGYRITTHMDHIDGNHSNNTLENMMELCPECHHRKSSENGDYCKH